MKKYTMEVSLSPKMFAGNMAHHWKVLIHTEDGIFPIADGWASSVANAIISAKRKSDELKLV